MWKSLLLFFVCMLEGISYASSFNLIRKHNIVFNQSEEPVIQTAIDIFKADLEKVSSGKIISGQSKLFIGTIGKSAELDKFIKQNHISIKDIKGKWEAFKIVCIDEDKLAIIGSDSRGTAYGVLELSRMMGVSPWEWWADVTPEKNRKC